MSVNNILEFLEETARKTPERIAFADESESLTFGEFLQRTRAIGSAVSEMVPPRQPVAVLMNDRSVNTVAALMGIVYAGCCYVPLDASLPEERLALIAQSLCPALVLMDMKGEKAARSFDCPAIHVSDAIGHDIDARRLDEIRAQASADDPMAIMYTSGSTGIPKGVVQSMRSHILYTTATIEKYDFTADTVFGNQSPFFYANSIIDIFPTLALGAKTVILPAGALAFPAVLIEQLNLHRVIELTMTPSSYVKVASSGVLTPGCLPHLKYIVLSGEAAHWATLEKWLAAAPEADVWNFYGSTEMYSVAVWKLTKTYEDGRTIPVGPLYDGVEIVFTEEEGMLVHTPWLAEGYYRDQHRTDAVFFTGEDGKRYYRSGDMGMMDEENHLVVLGRKDTQIKHMGYRMEIGETELALLSAQGVKEGCCIFDRDSGVLHAFYTGEVDPKALTPILKKVLPRYAMPDKVHQLAEMPYTPTMKIDRKKLHMMCENWQK